jgi:hypothetical protein
MKPIIFYHTGKEIWVKVDEILTGETIIPHPFHPSHNVTLPE